jgi:hypothetical protein
VANANAVPTSNTITNEVNMTEEKTQRLIICNDSTCEKIIDKFLLNSKKPRIRLGTNKIHTHISTVRYPSLVKCLSGYALQPDVVRESCSLITKLEGYKLFDCIIKKFNLPSSLADELSTKFLEIYKTSFKLVTYNDTWNMKILQVTELYNPCGLEGFIERCCSVRYGTAANMLFPNLNPEKVFTLPRKYILNLRRLCAMHDCNWRDILDRIKEESDYYIIKD